ncbi:hypothetical protein [Uliginosibacterium aquaticum]|uniref:Lipoprotein SmpA/OmlA domain-containing protein n=1 Tax=Uliginosibacterium aquaticum TaxID=2731212 RepID=A0ABX2INQ1_9RHOO|nr:hypothetical protein [Uliginosibacterium aquaticum]NSL55660.1 hypothetical protein [Uliginosibacterium aquaticum]
MLRWLLILCAAILTACSAPAPLPPHAAREQVREISGREQLAGRIVGQPLAGGRFVRLEIGMSRSEVEQLIGRPAAVDAQSGGVGWLPYYFGSDAWSTESYYKGEGRLVFNADSRLILIDASEEARK